MMEDTWRRLEEDYAESPGCRATPVPDEEIEAASREIGLPFPEDYREYLRRYGAGIVGPYPIFGLRPGVSLMGTAWSVVEMNRWFHEEEEWPGTKDWLIISNDHAGNPWGIAPDGQVWISDHDFAVIEPVAKDFEDFLRRVCLDLPE